MTRNYRLLLSAWVVLILSVRICFGQSPPVQWVQQASGTQNFNGNSVALDSTGNVYVVGNQTVGNYCRFCGDGQGFLAKYDAYGTRLWSTNLGGGTLGYLNALCVRTDNGGNIFVGGTVSGRQTIGSTTIFATNGYSGFIAKFDGTGKLAWLRTQLGVPPGNSYALGNALTVDGNGNCYTVGRMTGFVNFGGTNFGSATLYASVNNIFVAKYSSDGTFVWAQQAGGNRAGFDSAEGLGVTADGGGNVLVSGDFSGAARWGNPFTGQTNLSVIPETANDAFLAKYDASGNLLWVSSFGVTNASAQASGVTVAPNGAVFVIGYDGLSNAAIIRRYGASGNVLWARLITFATAQSAFADSSNCLYVTGKFYGSANFGGTNSTSAVGNEDIFIAKYESGGNLMWVTSFGGIGNSYDNGQDVTVTSTGEVYATGYFSNAGFGDGTTDMFLMKLGFGGVQAGPVLDLQMYPGITISGLVGRQYQIQYSATSLTNSWQALTNLVLPCSPYIWADTSPSQQKRFYRAALVQP